MRPLSWRQQTILGALARGATLRYAIEGGTWRWCLDSIPADGRSVENLIRRGMVSYIDPREMNAVLVLTERGRAEVTR